MDNLVTRALEALRLVGQNLRARLAGGEPILPARPLARAFPRDRDAAERRVTRALHWLAALGSLFAGERTYHRPVHFVPPPELARFFVPAPHAASPHPANPRPARSRPVTPASRAAARLAYIRAVFATVPTATLAARLARRLGLTAQDAAWPHALIEIADPPATWVARHNPAAIPRVSPVQEAHAVIRAVRVFEKSVAQTLAQIEAELRAEPIPHCRE